MNKILALICCLCGFPLLRGAEGDLSPADVAMSKGFNKTELRGAAFFPSGDTFRQIYGDVLPSVQIEQARIFKNHPNLEVWGNVEWIFSNGKASQSCGKSTIDILNISTGLKGIGSVYRDFVYLYAGIGPDFGITFIKNRTDCCQDCDASESTNHCNFGVGGNC